MPDALHNGLFIFNEYYGLNYNVLPTYGLFFCLDLLSRCGCSAAMVTDMRIKSIYIQIYHVTVTKHHYFSVRFRSHF